MLDETKKGTSSALSDIGFIHSSIKKNPNLSKETKEAFSETQQDDSTKAKYREQLYKVQEIIMQRALSKQLELQGEPDPAKRDLILREIKDAGAFCSKLEEELRFLRRK